MWLSGPNELAVFVPLSQDADEARLAIKYSSYVLWCDARISPCGSDGQTHLVFGGMFCACLQAGDAGDCAARGFVEAYAVLSSGAGCLLSSRIVVWLEVVERVACTKVGEAQ